MLHTIVYPLTLMAHGMIDICYMNYKIDSFKLSRTLKDQISNIFQRIIKNHD